MSDTPQGRFCWYELMTSDPDAATEFYANVTGWSTEPWAGGPTPYTVLKSGDAAVAGLMLLPEQAAAQGAPPHWVAYISTPDIDGTIKEVPGIIEEATEE